VLFCFYCPRHPRDLPSFPPRRSSDLLPLSGCNQSVGIVFAEAADHAQAQADAVFALAVVLQSAVPVAVAYVYRPGFDAVTAGVRSEEHTSELQSRENLVCRLLLEKKK